MLFRPGKFSPFVFILREHYVMMVLVLVQSDAYKRCNVNKFNIFVAEEKLSHINAMLADAMELLQQSAAAANHLRA